MIVDGFSIENWTCIGKVAVDDLPATGVIVFHAPNESGKSSIVAAIRACLMDIPSSSKRLEKCYPRATKKKPRVSVAFRTNGQVWRISKQFGSKEGRLEQLTSPGNWRIVESEAKSAHAKTCELVGGSDSGSGLQQLLWLTQAEFHLPDAKKFDPNVQAQLRGVLGVLQTPLDDRFLATVKRRWNSWHSDQQKGKQTPKLKANCSLAINKAQLEKEKQALQETEERFRDIERKTERVSELEVTSRDLRRQLRERTKNRDDLREEYQRSLTRLQVHEQAKERLAAAEKQQAAALQQQALRTEAAGRLRDAEKAVEPASARLADCSEKVQAAEKNKQRLSEELSRLRQSAKEAQKRRDAVQSMKQLLSLQSQVASIQKNIDAAQEFERLISEIQDLLDENPAPPRETMDQIRENRSRATQLRANLDAAAMRLTVTPDPGAASLEIIIDDGPAVDALKTKTGEPLKQAVRRKAAVRIPNWGRIELDRGEDTGTIDEIEDELQKADRTFAEAVAPFGIPASDPRVIDRLLERMEQNKYRRTEIAQQKKELNKIAPRGCDPLRSELRTVQTKITHLAEALHECDLPDDLAALERSEEKLKDELGELEERISSFDAEQRSAEQDLQGAREQENQAREARAVCNTDVKNRNEELDRLPSAAEVEGNRKTAETALEKARQHVSESVLTDEEQTIKERLAIAEDSVKSLQKRINETSETFHQIKGSLEASEGLHQQRAAAAARVEMLGQLVEREALERDAVNRLFHLFEECREKQLGAVMAPIEKRVVGWMRLLGMGNYQSVHFSDSFLPEKMTTGDGAADFALSEVSTGAQEQIGMMVRLALGSTLSTHNEPAVAVLDDPLTHSDTIRLDRMRAVLRSAAAGDPNMTPPAGPLQILIFTCHPEWFDAEGARVIDLGAIIERNS